MLLAPSATGAQQQPPVFRSGVDMTRIKVAVLDDNGAPVTGLSADAFAVREDGAQQRLDVVLSPADVPLDVAIVIDFSASIDAEWADPQAREAAERFLDSLSPSDCVYLLPFQEQIGPGVWANADDRALRHIIAEYPYGWSTKLYDAIRAAHGALDARAPGHAGTSPPPAESSCGAPLGQDESLRRRAAIVVLTDGQDSGSRVQYADVLLASHQANRPVFSVAVGLAGGRRQRSRYLSHQAYRQDANYGQSLQDQLAELSRVSGGHLVTQRDIGDGYDDVLALLRGYYVLGYRTPQPVSEGWHRVQVQVAGDYQTITQPGVYRSETDYAQVSDALRTATEALNADTRLALRMLELAAVLAPDLSTPQFGRGVALERLNRFAEARAAYEQALLLSPGAAEVRSRLARLTLRLHDYGAAWTHALRLQRIGHDADGLIARLELIAAEPADRQARRRGPRIALPKSLTPDLDAQLALRPVWRDIGHILERDPTITIVPFGSPADFALRLDLRELEARSPRRMDLRLDLLDVYMGNETETRVELDDIDDREALASAIERSVEDALQWIHERMRRRR